MSVSLFKPFEDQTVRSRRLSDEEASLLRRYKQFLQRHQMAEKLWCNRCAELGRQEGVGAVVTDSFIEIRCRCTNRTYRG
jgi:hypothetical protein